MLFANSTHELWTGIDSVDSERRKLFALIDALIDTFDSFAAASDVAADFAELDAQVTAEFAAEEQFMRAVKYPAYNAHKAEHERLLAQFRLMIEAYEEGTCTLCGTNLRTCMESWLGDHIRNADTALKTLVN